MLGSIFFLSAEKMASVRPSGSAAVISILDRCDEKHRPCLNDFHSSLTLHFSDWAEEFVDAPPGEWDDNPTEEMHLRLSVHPSELLPALSDADKIVGFIGGLQAEQTILDLYVHCMGGISRSAAVALWASGKFRAPIANDDSVEHPNPRLLRLLLKADEAARLRDRSAFFALNVPLISMNMATSINMEPPSK